MYVDMVLEFKLSMIMPKSLSASAFLWFRFQFMITVKLCSKVHVFTFVFKLTDNKNVTGQADLC